MAVTSLIPDSSVESVKLAVRSAAACSNTTVLIVQSLLRESPKASTGTENPVRRNRSTTKSSTGCKTLRGTRKDATVNTLVDGDGTRLSTQEKLVLATELFNTSLKTLSGELKNHGSMDRPADGRPKTPLQPNSPNRTRSSAKTTISSKYKQHPAETQDGIVAVAECARLALSSLRALKVDEGEGNGYPNIQLEQGACVLAGRLIALGLNDIAYKELKALKRRILQHLDQRPDGKSSSRSKARPAEEEPAKGRMSDLPVFSELTNARPLYGLLVSFQGNAMRLIAAEKKPSTVQKICPSLQLSDANSPAKIIIAAMESGSLSRDKAALQLQLHSNTVLSLWSGTRDQLKPITTLTLQLLSLDIKCAAWKLAGHVCDETKEMWDPLARYLASFAHHINGMEKSDFISIYRIIIRLRSGLKELEESATNLNSASVARITTILGQLAQDAGCFDEALKLFTEALTPLSAGQSLSLATVRCKLASTHFQASKSSGKNLKPGLSNAISETSTALGLPLKGNSNDLDELLVEAAKLKKFAMAWLGESVSKGLGTTEQSDTHDRIREYLHTFLRFLRRYIGRQPAEEHDAKEHEAFHKRITMSRSIVLAAVDSAVVMGKVSLASQRPAWEGMLLILADCQRLLTTIECISDDSESGGNIGLTFVKLSNLFWSRYVKEKECEKDCADLIPLLRQSASLLSTCSPSQRNIGFAAVKLERLAHLYQEGKMGAESEKAFCQSIKEHIDAGALQQVASDSSGNFPHRVCQDPKSSSFMLGRVLSSFLKMKLRQRDSMTQAHFDDALDHEETGVMLEWQMGLLTELHGYAHSSGHFRGVFSLILFKALDIYSIKTYPVRRLRVMLYAMRFSLEHPGSLESTLLQKVVEEGERSLEVEHNAGEDGTISPYLTHIKNSLRLTIGLHQGSLQPAELSQVISSWTSMAWDSPDQQSLESRIIDLDYWVLQIKAVVDYTEIHGLQKIQLAALELILRITELQESADFSDATIILSRLVMQYCRHGHCRKAGDLLTRADQYLSQNDVSCLATLSYKLARTEFLIETGDVDKAGGVLSTVRALYEKNQKKLDLGSVSVLSKIAWERLVADAAFIHSRLSFTQGSTTHALFFSKLSVRLNCRLWAKVEKIAQKKQDKMLESGSSDIDTVVEGITKLDVSQPAPETPITYSQGAPFWPHIDSHHAALLNLSSLSAYHGMFQDAIYYGEQALKINKTLNANVRLVASQAQLGSQWIFGGHIPEGQELLGAAENMSKQLDSGIELASLQMGLASLHKSQGLHDDEFEALQQANTIISGFMNSENSGMSSSSITDLEEKMDKMRIRGTRSRQQQTATTARRTRAATSTSKTGPKKTTANAEPALESKSLLQVRGDIRLQQAGCSRALRDFEKAADLLNDARKFAVSKDSQIPLHIGESEHLLADAIRRFATHAVYCVLPESTISLPALQSPKKDADTSAGKEVAKPSTTRRQRATSRAQPKRPRASEDFSVMLSKAGDSLNSVFDAATVSGSTFDSHAASRLMSRISMLAHATTPGCSVAWSSPANVNEIGRVGAFSRERKAIDIDKQLAGFSDPLEWPSASISTVELDDTICADFNKEYVDILPESWNVLSLSLSADRTEFVVSRLRKGHSPFLLRLPLRRGNTDEDEEQFTFDDGREEMQEIIKLANQSAHAAKAQVDKRSKKEWWRNREALDQRLESLLQNIENVWFGGFKGIFSPVPRETTPLSRFAKSFHTIIDNHLPSRRKGGRSATPKLTLHQNVLELFIGIKDLEKQEDPEDTLMDLLYFVVDILQFQGERNAYDEIDFDMMVVDTLDALRNYHKQVDEEEQSPHHTVLILDKSLHAFPWESLPSLQGYPVCRVPSLECLRQRIQQFRNEETGHVAAGLDRRDGSYILNPAGDLRTTQGSFETELSGLDGWSGIVKREPSEDEFKHALESKSLFLYFGHGSGAQYIRGRTIKRLERCAVTFLMGCSSGTLTEAGEYEPYGTPMNYLQAGSPALVATLWDVTDKDIDRFARSTFEHWGLFDGGGKSLDEAVGKSRSVCVLKYLNGAAPVIYGVPGVFLE